MNKQTIQSGKIVPKRTSIQHRQIWGMMLTVWCVLLLACGSFAGYQWFSFRASTVRNVASLASVIGANCTGALDFDDRKTLEEILSSLRHEPHVEKAFVYRPNRDLAGKYLRAGATAEFMPPSLESGKAFFQSGTLIYRQSILHDRSRLGELWLVVDLQGFNEQVMQQGVAAGVVFVIASLVAYLLAAQIGSRMIGPILELALAARKVTLTRDYSVKVLSRTNDELATLTQDFNQMLSEIQRQDHELRRNKMDLEERVDQRTSELEGSISLLSATLEASGDGVLVVDMEGCVRVFNENCRVLWRSSDALVKGGHTTRIWGYLEALVADVDEFRIRMAEIEQWADAESEDLLHLLDGRYIERQTHPQKNGDLVVGRVWTFRDVTLKKEAELAIQRARESAERSNRAKSDFLANMSHEIRTPMNGIIGMTHLALGTTLNRQQKGYLETALGSAQALMIVLNDILDFSKIESGKLQLDPVEFDVRGMMGQVIKSCSVGVARAEVDIICHVESGVPRLVKADSLRLRQVLMNLLSNALKFTHTGYISLNVRHESDDRRDRLFFEVQDSGIGIPLDKQADIFRPFEQADGSTTRRYGGTGLGLTICRQLVELMGGMIQVESEAGKGSKFSFGMRVEVIELSQDQCENVHAPLQGVRALIVGKTQVVATNLSLLSADLGLNVTEAVGFKSGIAALQGAVDRGMPYGLLILEVMQSPPSQDGEEMELVRACAWQGGVSVIVTEEKGRINSSQLKELGLAGIVVKPVMVSDLGDTLLRALGFAGPSPQEELKPAAVPAAVRRMKFLVAEDNGVNQILIQALIEKLGHESDVAEDGEEAVQAHSRGDYDAIFMDMQMPNMDGLQASACIREAEVATGRHIPIVALTANAMAGDRDRCIQSGMDDYLSKPIDPAKLKQMIAKIEAWPRASERTIADMAAIENTESKTTHLRQRLTLAFIESCRRDVDRIGELIQDGDFNGVQSAAQALKGAAMSFVEARGVVAAAVVLETAARTGELSDLMNGLILIQEETGRAKVLLEDAVQG